MIYKRRVTFNYGARTEGMDAYDVKFNITKSKFINSFYWMFQMFKSTDSGPPPDAPSITQ